MAEAEKILEETYLAAHDLFGDKLCDAYLYGSYARGDFTPESDVDILLSVDMTREELMNYFFETSHIGNELSLEHDVTVSIAVKPNAEFRRFSSDLPYYRNVIKEGIRYGS